MHCTTIFYHCFTCSLYGSCTRCDITDLVILSLNKKIYKHLILT